MTNLVRNGQPRVRWSGGWLILEERFANPKLNRSSADRGALLLAAVELRRDVHTCARSRRGGGTRIGACRRATTVYHARTDPR